jgi:hypothetical protein
LRSIQYCKMFGRIRPQLCFEEDTKIISVYRPIAPHTKQTETLSLTFASSATIFGSYSTSLTLRQHW